jgi:arylsulfatase A-like enzyme
MPDQNLTRRTFLKKITAAGAAGFVFSDRSLEVEVSTRLPNIVMILSDDQGWGDLSIHGNTNLQTPNIDSIATDGAIFDRFYVCAVCAPTRAEMLTGRYHLRGGINGTSTGVERLNTDEKTIGDTFKSAGYATAVYGKWHNGTQWPYHPNARGFDDFYGFPSGHWGHYFDWKLEHNGQIVWGNGYISDDLTDHALDFIEKNKKKPFFCYLPFNTPHSPMQVPDSFWDEFENHPIPMRNRAPQNEDVDKTRAALAMCENIDYNVGRVLKKLDDLKLANDTIVIYFSDNGPNSVRWNDGMKGKKGSTDEGGVRVPCMIRWPGHIEAGKKITQIAGAIDLLPSLADMAGIPIVGNKRLDGITLKPLLLENPASWPDRMIFTHQKERFSVRTQRYRLDNDYQLFDMVKDPGQYNDISHLQPKIKAKLTRALDNFKNEVLPEPYVDDRPFAVGYPEFPVTMLPARDGIEHGNIIRPNAPNCSYFRNWIDIADSITWDIEVATAGTYKAQIYYTCPASDVGSTIELEFEGSTTQTVVTPANDPPLIGAAHDRVPRGEDYVKDFHPLDMGNINLSAARGLLTLKAINITGVTVMDVRGVILTLQ